MDTTNYDTKMAELRAAASNGQLTKESIEEIAGRTARVKVVIEPGQRARSNVGRPKGPDKVVYKRNVEPAMVKQLDEFIKGGADSVIPKPVEHDPILHLVNCTKESENELKAQIQALLEDVAKLTKERDELLVKRENWVRATESDKVRFWINRHDQLKASLVKGEYDQSV